MTLDSSTSILPRLNINTELATRILTGFIRDSMTKAGMSRAVIGLSGGIDSAVSASLSARALGAENVLALRMPYRTSSAESLSDAEAVIEDLGIPHLTVPISDMADPLISLFPEMSKLRQGNIMARMRMIALYDQSMAWGGLVMGTSNKTEFLLGYSTIYGDSGVALHPDRRLVQISDPPDGALSGLAALGNRQAALRGSLGWANRRGRTRLHLRSSRSGVIPAGGRTLYGG